MGAEVDSRAESRLDSKVDSSLGLALLCHCPPLIDFLVDFALDSLWGVCEILALRF